MPNIQILGETPLSMAEMKEELDKIKKRDKELNFRSQRTDEYLQQFVENKKAIELKKKLMDLNIPRLRDLHMCKIIDVMPLTQNDLRAVLQGYSVTISNESMKKITDLVDEYQ